MSREKEIIKEKEKKIEELRKQKINPYAHNYEKKHLVADCLKLSVGGKVRTAGRILNKREIGRISFSDLMDFSGKIQLMVQEGKISKKDFEFFLDYIDVGDIVGVEGEIIETKTKQKSILVKNLSLLTKSLLPLPSKWYGLQNKEERYRRRYLDLIINPEVRDAFEKRRKILELIREFMKSRGFVEVETPILQPIYGGTNAKPFETKLNALNMKVYLRISNEIYLKRLIVGGYEKVFEFSPDFRNEGIDKFHNPEFTQVETMWAYADYKDNMEFAEDMVSFVVKGIHGKTKIKIQGRDIEFKTPWKREKFLDLIKKETNVDFSKVKNFNEVEKAIKNLNVDISGCDNAGEAMVKVFEEKVQGKIIQPTLVYDYPLEAAGLAKNNEENPNFIDSFEIIVNGMELGLSYCEQNDPKSLENYWKVSEERLKKGHLEAQKKDEDFLYALKIGMPPTSGLGVGIDRLAMLITDNPSIRDVIMFPFMRSEEK